MEELLVPLGGLLGLVNTALHHLHIGHDQLDVDDADIPGGVHGHVGAGVSYHMHDVLVIEAAHHVDDGVALPDVGHHTHVGIDGAEGAVGALGAGVGNGVEQGALAHIGKAHNA